MHKPTEVQDKHQQGENFQVLSDYEHVGVRIISDNFSYLLYNLLDIKQLCLQIIHKRQA